MLTGSAHRSQGRAPLDFVDDYRDLSEPEWTEWKKTKGRLLKNGQGLRNYPRTDRTWSRK